MNQSELSNPKSPGAAADVIRRVILSMGGKGGVGKTALMTSLAEWFDDNQIPVKLLDLDIENKARGSLTHFFGGRVPKINIYTPAGLDAFIDHLSDEVPVILADMGAGAGQITYEWFDRMYPEVAVRQWVLSVPFALRYRLAYDSSLVRDVLQIFVRTVFASIRKCARQQDSGFLIYITNYYQKFS
jgi:hypothetical protein